MPTLSETLQMIFKEAAPSICAQAAALIEKCQKDKSPLLRDLARQTQKAVADLAAGRIDADMFQDLMADATSLQKIQSAKLSAQSKIRAQKTFLALKKLLIDGLSKLAK